MKHFQSELRKLISLHTQGTTSFANLIGKAHESFFGTGLSESKTNAYCAAITGVKNGNVFKAIGTQSDDSVINTAHEALRAICNRSEDNIFDDNYLDFFFPIFTRPERNASEPTINVKEHSDAWRCNDCGATWSLGAADSDVPEICPHCLDESAEDATLMHLGIWTTVEFDNEENRIRITQSIKSYDDETGEYSECVIAPSTNFMASAPNLYGSEPCSTIPFKAEYLRDDAIKTLSDIQDERFKRLVNDWMKTSSKPNVYNVNNALINLVRGFQTMELDRIINAIGVNPTPDFMSHQSQLCLFDGYIPYTEL